MRRLVLPILIAASLLGGNVPALAGGVELTVIPGRSDAAGASAGRMWTAGGASVTLRTGYCLTSETAPASRWSVRLMEPHAGRELGPFGAVTAEALGAGCDELLATLTVPDLSAGMYGVTICTRTCGRTLISGSIAIAPTPEAARLTALAADLRARLRSSVALADLRSDRVAKLRRELTDLEGSLAEALARAERATSQRDVALDGREIAVAQVEATDRESRNWRVAAYLLALAMTLTWVVAAVRRRGVVRIRIPDTVESLDETDDRADH